MLQKQILTQINEILDAIEYEVYKCSDELWNNRSITPKYWYQIYHTLFFLDFHLSDSPYGFKPPFPFKVLSINFSNVEYEDMYSKKDIVLYIQHVKSKTRRVMETLTRTKLKMRCCFAWLEMTNEELFVYIISQMKKYVQQISITNHVQIEKNKEQQFEK
jgi:hypothetical protein